eukprot:1002155-Prorocentrum_minimum.AAC.1
MSARLAFEPFLPCNSFASFVLANLGGHDASRVQGRLQCVPVPCNVFQSFQLSLPRAPGGKNFYPRGKESWKDWNQLESDGTSCNMSEVMTCSNRFRRVTLRYVTFPLSLGTYVKNEIERR